MNREAIRKILKKHDKISSICLQDALAPFVDERAFSSYQSLEKIVVVAQSLLMDRVGSTSSEATTLHSELVITSFGTATAEGGAVRDGSHTAPPASLTRIVAEKPRIAQRVAAERPSVPVSQTCEGAGSLSNEAWLDVEGLMGGRRQACVECHRAKSACQVRRMFMNMHR